MIAHIFTTSYGVRPAFLSTFDRKEYNFLIINEKIKEYFGPKDVKELVAIIALGANLGNPQGAIRRAIARLGDLSDEPVKASSLWETSPVDCPPGSPPFVNAVVALKPRAGETPESLLGKLQELEKVFGRRPKQVLNEARPLDLDLIAFGDERRSTERLVLPHPRAHERRFVLQPLSEIAPELVLPGQMRSVAELLRELPVGSGMRLVR
jgi:2-amino-4-hydroxy-6-hydroxymethyldihydropteridine diphosphokinase